MTATSLTMIDDEAYGAVRAICVKRARGLGLGPEDAEYVAQDVVLSLMTQDEAPLNPAAWAMTVTKYRVMDRFRAQQRRPDQRKLEEFAGSRRELDHFVGRQFNSSELASVGCDEADRRILSTVVSAPGDRGSDGRGGPRIEVLRRRVRQRRHGRATVLGCGSGR